MRCVLKRKRNKNNLNDISHDAAISLIRAVLANNITLSEVFVDTVGDPNRYQAKLKNLFPQIENITVSKKADSLFPIVSAASIVAKVTRDRSLKFWEYKEHGLSLSMKFGSGYTSDPVTKQWLNSNIDHVFGYPTVTRFSWSTTQKLLDRAAVRVLWDDDEHEDDYQLLFKPPPRTNTDRYRFFTENSLDQVDEF
jgi:ribonuclease H2 subunit A